MTTPPTLSAVQIREVGEALFGPIWQADMAKGLGVPRQSVAYYLRSGGVSGAQAAAIIGLVSRTVHSDAAVQRQAQLSVQARHDGLMALLVRLETAS